MVNKKNKSKISRTRLLAQVFIVILVVLIWVFVKLLPDIFLDAGKVAFQKKDYKTAYSELSRAVMLSPKNSEARLYYAKTLLVMRPTIEVQKELFRITQNDFADCADLFAQNQMDKWRTQIKDASGTNYIERVPMDSGILRWDINKFPLKVCIKKNSANAPDYYEAMITKAFLQWQSETNDFIKFRFVSDEKESNIDVVINSSAGMKNCSGEDCKYAVASTTPQISGDVLKKMNIEFYDLNNVGKPFSETEIFNTALHEIGHSLGIMGHSQDENDILYMETNPNVLNDEAGSGVKSISSNDLNTLSLLYKLFPDVTNTPLNQVDIKGQFYAPIVIGNTEEISSQKIMESQNYIKAAPNIPNGYIDLASAYAETKQFNLAITTLDKALSLCSNDNERFLIYYNFAVIYMRLKDWNDAIKNAQIAEQMQPSSDVEGLIAMAQFNSGNKELAKKAYIEALSKTPEDIINSYNLATIYLREFNLIDAGRVLNKLVKANPEAKNDARIRRYGLIMFLFH